ncbi:glycoside-pentoside-hexuronide (GPH):cation symporter [Paenibacillus illinoisensis]|uniref:MFS transporter n=1 Tax=Paenibacillus illinoisensis TaxID=59845 RepID=UPI00301A8162
MSKIESATNRSNNSVTVRERIGYAMGDVGVNFVWIALTSFITFFYTDVVGIGPIIVGNILAAARIMDGFTDIGMGALVDKTSSGKGKGRPWLLWMCVPFAILSFLVFTVPDLSPTGVIVYATVTYLLVNIAYSAIYIPYNVMNTTIIQDPYQRSILTVFRIFFSMGLGVIITSEFMNIINKFGGDQSAWIMVMAVFSILCPIFIFISYKGTTERVRPSVVRKEIPFKRAFKGLMRNKFWFIMLALQFITAFIVSISNAINVYFAQYVFGDLGIMGVIAISSLLPIVLGMLIVGPIIKRFGNRNTALAGAIIQFIGIIVMALDPNNLLFLITGLVIKGLGTAPIMATLPSMMGDTVEYGEWKTGMRTEGLVFSAASVGNKIGAGLGAAAIGWILGFAGYIGGQEYQTSQALLAIKSLMIYIPMGLTVIVAILLMMFTIEKKRPIIIAELERLRNQT